MKTVSVQAQDLSSKYLNWWLKNKHQITSIYMGRKNVRAYENGKLIVSLSPYEIVTLADERTVDPQEVLREKIADAIATRRGYNYGADADAVIDALAIQVTDFTSDGCMVISGSFWVDGTR